MILSSVARRSTLLVGLIAMFATTTAFAALPIASGTLTVNGWKMQDVARVPDAGEAVSSAGFAADSWYRATVPGTALTTLVDNHVYPEPLYGENNRPEMIPESLARTSYWYRAVLDVPRTFAGKHVWLNFDGINYSAVVWVNGIQVGTMRGAFRRGTFDISANVRPGRKAVIAVLVSPQPHPGEPHEHTLRAGMGLNGGITAVDGPTFLSTIGWDWIPAIRDRDAGIWQKVFLSTTGAVRIKNPLVTSTLPLPRTDSADIAVETTVENLTDRPMKGVVKGRIEQVVFQQSVDLPAHASKLVKFDVASSPSLRMAKPRLWWPNGYGPQNLYKLHLTFESGQSSARVSDVKYVTFGVREITYAVPDSDNLTISVNGVRVFIRGGNWGLDDAMKRIPRERLEAQIKLHKLANLNLIRNWVGQSTSEDFYELCDKYGLMLWDEFFQPNPSDGPNPTDLGTYLFNVREKILRFRNHPAIAVWCARNEGFPPKAIDDALRVLMAELEPKRMYQPSSTEGHGVSSGGPYHWRTPREFYNVDTPFKTEIGSVSVPTLESIHGMMPQKDWETVTDDWAEHDFAKGASDGDKYPGVLAARYGKVSNLADFVRKGQMMNFEAFRAMYEGRNAKMFKPATGVITWMSHPAQPSFVWQLYHYDLEPNSALFAVRKAGEMVHVQLNQANDDVQVINNLPDAVTGTVNLTIYNLDGSVAKRQAYPVTATASNEISLGKVDFPAPLSAVHFVRLELQDVAGKLLSENFYWRAPLDSVDDLTALDGMPKVTLNVQVARKDAEGKCVLSVKLRNPTDKIALMAHLQLRRQKSGQRVLPVFYSDNYVSLAPQESRVVTIEADLHDLGGEGALVMLDGWNVDVAARTFGGASVAANVDAAVEHSPVTGLPFQTEGLR